MDLQDCPEFLRETWKNIVSTHVHLEDEALLQIFTEEIKENFIRNLINSSKKLLMNYSSPWEARNASYPLISLSSQMKDQLERLENFLIKNFYHSDLVEKMWERAHHVIPFLFEEFVNNPSLLPKEWQPKSKEDSIQKVVDYIASLTDLGAIKEYRRLFGRLPKLFTPLSYIP